MNAKHLALWTSTLLTFAALSAAAQTIRAVAPANARIVAESVPDTGKSTLVASIERNAPTPPEWAAGCPVPTLDECQQPGYLQGDLDDALGCGALQGANHWTCSQLLQDAGVGYEAGPSVFARNLVPAGVVANVGHVPQDAEDASATSFSGELTSPGNQYYGASLFADGQASEDFVAVDPRGIWQGGDESFDSCQEYAHDSYYEVANFWYEVGHDRHDYLRTFDIAFGAWLSHGSIGTRHTDGSMFTDVEGQGVLPSSRVVYRNRFFDLPGVEGPALKWAGAAPDLRGALSAYDPHGLEIVQLVEANGEQGTKDMEFYQAYFDNLTVEAVPGLGLSADLGDDGDEEPGIVFTIGGDDDDGFGLTDASDGDPLIAITGQVPLEFSGGKVMRRMFVTELDELYDLQQEKDRLVDEWRALDRHYAGSGWTIQDLLDELHPELGLTAKPDFGVCCGDAGPQFTNGDPDDGDDDVALDAALTGDPPPPDPHANLSAESAARMVVLDGLLAVYAKATDAGCLDAGVTYCDFSVKEFALEAIPNVNEEEQDAYEECLAILPPPFVGNLGQTRKIVDPVADTHGVAVPDELADEYESLLGMECFVAVDEQMSASHMHWIEDQTKQCRETIPDYQTQLAAFFDSVALYEAKARLASHPELVDPDTGEIVRPGRSSSWDEHKGSKYFGVGMQYDYAFDTDVDENICNFDLTAGGDFAADFDILAHNFELVDVRAWVSTTEELTPADMHGKLVDVHAEVLGIALFDAIEVEGLGNGQTYDFEAVVSDERRTKDFAGFTTNFFLGPIPMSISVGAGGGIGYRVALSDDSGFTLYEGTEQGIDVCPELVLGATFEPYVGFYGFMEVAIDIVIARAGVRGEITILEIGIPVTLDMSLAAVDAPAPPYVDLELGVGMSVAARFESLSGRISAFGELGPCPICLRLEKNIVKWDGFRWDKTLYEQEYEVSVADLARVLGN